MTPLISCAVGERLSLVRAQGTGNREQEDRSIDLVVVRTRGAKVVFSTDADRVVRKNRVSAAGESAEHLYSAYGAFLGWTDERGRPLPEWSALSGRQRSAWRAAAQLGQREQGTGNRVSC